MPLLSRLLAASNPQNIRHIPALDSRLCHRMRTLRDAGKIVAPRNPQIGQVDLLMHAVDQARGKTGRSSLYRWLRKHHDDLLARLEAERPDWQALAQGFVTLGLTDRTGKAASPETARKTWLTVRKDIIKAKAKQAKAAPALAPGEIAPGVRAAVQPPAQIVDDALRPPIKIDNIRPVQPRIGTPAATPLPSQSAGASPLPPPPVKSASGADDAEAQIRRVLDEFDAGKVPIPKTV